MEHGEEEHSLWINLLTYFSHMKKIDEKRLRSVLTYIEEHHIMPVLSVLDALSKCESITLDLMKDYILKELEESHNQQEQNRSYIDDLKKKNQEMSDEIIKLQTSCKVFQQQYCANCGDKLDVPTVHYMCGHSFHQRCVADRSEGCPKCHLSQQTLHRAKSPKSDMENDYLNDLQNGSDGFQVSANYIAKGLFQVCEENDKTPEEKEEEQILEAQKYEKYNDQVPEDFKF